MVPEKLQFFDARQTLLQQSELIEVSLQALAEFKVSRPIVGQYVEYHYLMASTYGEIAALYEEKKDIVRKRYQRAPFLQIS